MAATRASADLSGRVAIVTGAGARGDGIGNGRAAAILLAEAGAHVLAVDRKPELAEATVEMIGGDDMVDELAEARRRASVLKIEGNGWDVGAAVRFLCTDEARYITGHTLVVDGGVTLRGPSRASPRG